MSAMTDYTEALLANWLLRAQSVSQPTTVHLALHTADPGEASPHAAETTYTGYARQQITFGPPAAGTGVVQNSAAVTFGANTGAAVTITHWSIWDNGGAGAGNCLAYGALNTSKQIDTNDVPSFPIGAISLTFA